MRRLIVTIDGNAPMKKEQDSRKGNLRVLIAGGGTGGHIFPALAVAQELRARSVDWAHGQCTVEFIGTTRGLESRVIPTAGFRLHTVAAAGLKGMGGMRRLRNLLILPKTFWQSGALLRQFRPHAVLGLGGYVAGPVMLEAALVKIPTLLVEPNASPGFTSRALAPWIRFAALGFENAASFYGTKARVTGYPVRKPFTQIAPKVHASPFTLLILGGSQGSAAINRVVLKALPLFAAQAPPVKMIHQTGERDFDQACAAYRDAGLQAEVHAFIQGMPEALGRADLVICRAGASTLAELTAAGRASLLIPFPAATDDHQSANARVLEGAGAAGVLNQRDLTAEKLVEEICALLAQPDKLTEMERRARALAHPDAAARIADLIELAAR